MLTSVGGVLAYPLHGGGTVSLINFAFSILRKWFIKGFLKKDFFVCILKLSCVQDFKDASCAYIAVFINGTVLEDTHFYKNNS